MTAEPLNPQPATPLPAFNPPAFVAEPATLPRPVPQPIYGAEPVVAPTAATVARTGPSNGEFIRRVVVFLFGIAQGLIVLRIVLLVLDAREANSLVSGILNGSQLFVGPFEGILHTNALTAGGSMLDIAAGVALIGWTILEFVVIAAVGIFRREPA